MVGRVTQIESKEVLETYSKEYTVKIKGVFFVFSKNQQEGNFVFSTTPVEILHLSLTRTDSLVQH